MDKNETMLKVTVSLSRDGVVLVNGFEVEKCAPEVVDLLLVGMLAEAQRIVVANMRGPKKPDEVPQ